MACRLFVAKSLSEPGLEYCQFDPKEHISMKSQSKFKHFQENAFQCVVNQKSTILSQP